MNYNNELTGNLSPVVSHFQHIMANEAHKNTAYWVWASPALEPFNFSLVVQSGDDGFACYVHGNNQIWLPPDLASGYTDCMSTSLLQLI